LPRIRTFKPEVFKNEDLHALGAEAVLLFMGLWSHADREGRLEDRPGRLKVEILPYYSVDADALLKALHDAGFIHRYEVDGIKCIWIIKFKEHQRITGKEAETQSKLPEPPAGKKRGNTGETSETTGKERKGKEDSSNEESAPGGASASKTDSRMVRPTADQVAAKFREKGGTGQMAREYWAHYTSNGWKVGKNPMKDWEAAVDGWIAREGRKAEEAKARAPTNGSVPNSQLTTKERLLRNSRLART
jgi:hypothetical protein